MDGFPEAFPGYVKDPVSAEVRPQTVVDGAVDTGRSDVFMTLGDQGISVGQKPAEDDSHMKWYHEHGQGD